MAGWNCLSLTKWLGRAPTNGPHATIGRATE
jgi:hypothetical protein